MILPFPFSEIHATFVDRNFFTAYQILDNGEYFDYHVMYRTSGLKLLLWDLPSGKIWLRLNRKNLCPWESAEQLT